LLAASFAAAYVYPYNNGVLVTGFVTAAGYGEPANTYTTSTQAADNSSASTTASAGVAVTSTATAASMNASTTATGVSAPGDIPLESSALGGYVGYARLGSTFTIHRYGNPSTGYTWAVSVDNQSVVSYDQNASGDCSRYATTNANTTAGAIVGAGCDQEFVFQAVGLGSTTIHMTYARSWDPNSTVSANNIIIRVYPTINPTPTPAYCTEGNIAYKYCCGAGTMCERVCTNNTYTEQKVAYAGCNATATAYPVITPTATPAPMYIDQVSMQKGWNLYSVPLMSARLTNSTCDIEKTWYYDTAAQKYDQGTLTYVSTGRASWFYSDEDCVATYGAPKAYGTADYNVALKAGWNMISAPMAAVTRVNCPMIPAGSNITGCTQYTGTGSVPLSEMSGNCNITAAYSFDATANNWVAATALSQNTGYFVSVSGDCTLSGPDNSASIPPLPQ
jgi:predicted secreted protein